MGLSADRTGELFGQVDRWGSLDSGPLGSSDRWASWTGGILGSLSLLSHAGGTGGTNEPALRGRGVAFVVWVVQYSMHLGL